MDNKADENSPLPCPSWLSTSIRPPRSSVISIDGFSVMYPPPGKKKFFLQSLTSTDEQPQTASAILCMNHLIALLKSRLVNVNFNKEKWAQHLRANLWNKTDNSCSVIPGPESVTLTNSHRGVFSFAGRMSGTPDEGTAHESSAGGTNDTSYWMVIFRTASGIQVSTIVAQYGLDKTHHWKM